MSAPDFSGRPPYLPVPKFQPPSAAAQPEAAQTAAVQALLARQVIGGFFAAVPDFASLVSPAAATGAALGAVPGFELLASPHVPSELAWGGQSGGGSSGWQKREKETQKWARKPKKEDIPVEPLDPERQLHIVHMLQEAGGVLPLGRLTEKFPGLKRMQLQGVFELDKVGSNGQFEVRLPGCESAGAEIMIQGQALSKDQQLPDLDPVSTIRIRQALLAEPTFTLTMASIRELVPGINKKQLEKDFNLIRIDKKHFNVSLKPAVPGGNQNGGQGLPATTVGQLLQRAAAGGQWAGNQQPAGEEWKALFHPQLRGWIANGAAEEDQPAKRFRTE